ncbi:MAG: cell division protein FtsZ [Candidatus Aenigmatarchaeota archaeon]|nr:MAG: cell division protein FtsZ [Candidatus Aenigmarchaeota archaeon]
MGIKHLMAKKEKKKKREDREIEEILEKRKTQIKVVGAGGAGNNTITRLMEVGIFGAETIAINTDAQDLLFTEADKKVLIGKELTGGLGAGADPKIGMEAAKESKDELKKVLQGADMIFLTCGLGGGTGTGSLPVIADISKKLGALTVAIVTLPFTMEGKQRMENARKGLKNLKDVVDTLIVIPNDRLLEIVPDVSLLTAFKICDEILVNAVKGITELVTKPGLVNLDFADVRAVMQDGGLAMIGMGESNTDNRAIEAVEKALNNPLLTVDIEGAKGALINVLGGPDITIREAQQIVEAVSTKLSPEAKIIWGAQIEKGLEDTLRALLIVTGVKFEGIEEIFEKPFTRIDKREMEKILGVEVVR